MKLDSYAKGALVVLAVCLIIVCVAHLRMVSAVRKAAELIEADEENRREMARSLERALEVAAAERERREESERELVKVLTSKEPESLPFFPVMPFAL